MMPIGSFGPFRYVQEGQEAAQDKQQQFSPCPPCFIQGIQNGIVTVILLVALHAFHGSVQILIRQQWTETQPT